MGCVTCVRPDLRQSLPDQGCQRHPLLPDAANARNLNWSTLGGCREATRRRNAENRPVGFAALRSGSRTRSPGFPPESRSGDLRGGQLAARCCRQRLTECVLRAIHQSAAAERQRCARYFTRTPEKVTRMVHRAVSEYAGMASDGFSRAMNVRVPVTVSPLNVTLASRTNGG